MIPTRNYQHNLLLLRNIMYMGATHTVLYWYLGQSAYREGCGTWWKRAAPIFRVGEDIEGKALFYRDNGDSMFLRNAVNFMKPHDFLQRIVTALPQISQYGFCIICVLSAVMTKKGTRHKTACVSDEKNVPGC
jgi:hypothetical protein